MSRLLTILLAACLALASVSVRAADDADVARLQARMDTLQADPALGRMAAFEQMEARQASALLIGPGMVDPAAVAKLVPEVIGRLDLEQTAVILDAEGFGCLKDIADLFHKQPGRGIITPHAGEMAGLLGIDKTEIQANRAAIALQAAEYFQVVVILKGATTIIAGPGGKIYANKTGNVGLATSGSGDTLSGIIAGLAARGAPPIQAAAWAVYLHGSAGEQLAARFGPLGFLARELLPEIPGLMAGLAPDPDSDQRQEQSW